MAYKKITEADLLGIGLIGIPDTPGLSTEEMQEKFEETAREVIIPAFNRFVDDVTERDSNTYTKEETDRAISTKVQEIGSADMQKSVYDSDNDGVVDSADNGTFLYVHTAGSLTGTGRYGAFKATVTETLANVNVNGSAFNVRCGDESEIELTAGNWYSFILDGDTVNFKQGGAGLNFKVVGGTAQPASPKENIIWINTDVACGEYQFTTAEPTTKANGAALEIGDIWIKTHSYSDKTFNALKKNNVEISPINAYQWDGTAWKNKTAYIYISGAWVSLTMQFVTNGQRVTEFETLPNYWTTDISFKLAPTVTQYADNFQLYSKAATSGTRGGTVFLRTAVDFSKISTIEVTFSATSGDSDASLRLDLVCTTNKEHGYTPVATLNLYKSKTSIDENTAALDVSSITDMGYIGIAVGSCNTTNITMKITDFKAY